MSVTTRPTISDIVYANKAAGQHFFDTTTLEFFNSTIYPEVYGQGVFVTSERQPPFFDRSTGKTHRYPRYYKVRVGMPDGGILTIDESERPTLPGARRVAERLGALLSTPEIFEVFAKLEDEAPYGADIFALAEAAARV